VTFHPSIPGCRASERRGLSLSCQATVAAGSGNTTRLGKGRACIRSTAPSLAADLLRDQPRVVTLRGRWARVSLIIDGSSALNLRYFDFWNPSNRDGNIVAIAVRSAHDTSLRLLCEIRSHHEHES